MISLLLSLFISQASATTCSEWIESDYLCVYNNQYASVWNRQCDNYDLATQVCYPTNPNQWQSECSPWTAHQGFSCVAPNGRLQQEWTRVCTDLSQTNQICTKENPNE